MLAPKSSRGHLLLLLLLLRAAGAAMLCANLQRSARKQQPVAWEGPEGGTGNGGRGGFGGAPEPGSEAGGSLAGKPHFVSSERLRYLLLYD